MNWAYLAGFTDGDGCITRELAKGKYRYARLKWGQKESEAGVLREIGDFLRSNGINITERHFSVSTKGHKYPQAALEITNVEDTRKALVEMLPYLVVKRERAIEALAVLQQAAALKRQWGRKYIVASRPNCKNGHPWTPTSTYVTKLGRKFCRICHRESSRRYYRVA